MFKLYLLFVLNLKPPAMCSSDFNKYKEINHINKLSHSNQLFARFTISNINWSYVFIKYEL